jgi:hypothetical protein
MSQFGQLIITMTLNLLHDGQPNAVIGFDFESGRRVGNQ